MTLQVLGLSGKAGVGKDYIYEHFIAPMGFRRWALADHFKIWAIGRGMATYDEVFHTKPPHVRKALQQLGTEEGRNVFGENVWLDTTWAWMEHLAATWGITKFCVTDARFVNEVEYIQARGGKVVRIVAPTRVAQSSLTPEARQHISETALDDYPLDKFDGVLYNDPGDHHGPIRITLGELAGIYPAQAELMESALERPLTPEQRELLSQMSLLNQDMGLYQ